MDVDRSVLDAWSNRAAEIYGSPERPAFDNRAAGDVVRAVRERAITAEATRNMSRNNLQDFDAGVEITEHEPGILNVELHYPRSEGHVTVVEIDQVSVRASDSIRVAYAYDRDGWAISQASIFCWDGDAGERSGEEDWQEVAFVPAWARKRACAGCDDPSVAHPSGRCTNCGRENGPAKEPG